MKPFNTWFGSGKAERFKIKKPAVEPASMDSQKNQN